MLPQLADSFRRVRAAQTLRGGDSGRVRGLRRLLVPVLEDSLERSLALAAGMDTRGYGRTAGATRARTAYHRGLMLLGLCAHLRRRLRRARPDHPGLGRAARCSWSASLVSVVGRPAAPAAGSAARRYRPAPLALAGGWSWPRPACVVGAAVLVDVPPPADDRLPRR